MTEAIGEPTLKIYGVAASQPARAVIWLCLMKRLPFQLIPTGPIFGKTREKDGPKLRRLDGVKDDSLLLLNPRATVPIIDDDGFVLWESHAIMEYLCVKHAWTDLYPEAPQARARVSQYLHFHHRNVREATRFWSKTIWKNIYARPNPSEAWMRRNTFPALTNNEQTVENSVRIVEGMLRETRTFLTGPSPTLADISCYEEFGQNQPKFANVQDFSEFPEITRWLVRMEGLPAFAEAHAILTMIGDVTTVNSERINPVKVNGREYRVAFNETNAAATEIIQNCVARYTAGRHPMDAKA